MCSRISLATAALLLNLASGSAGTLLAQGHTPLSKLWSGDIVKIMDNPFPTSYYNKKVVVITLDNMEGKLNYVGSTVHVTKDGDGVKGTRVRAVFTLEPTSGEPVKLGSQTDKTDKQGYAEFGLYDLDEEFDSGLIIGEYIFKRKTAKEIHVTASAGTRGDVLSSREILIEGRWAVSVVGVRKDGNRQWAVATELLHDRLKFVDFDQNINFILRYFPNLKKANFPNFDPIPAALWTSSPAITVELDDFRQRTRIDELFTSVKCQVRDLDTGEFYEEDLFDLPDKFVDREKFIAFMAPRRER